MQFCLYFLAELVISLLKVAASIKTGHNITQNVHPAWNYDNFRHKTKACNVVRLISQLLLSRIKLMRGGAVEPFCCSDG